MLLTDPSGIDTFLAVEERPHPTSAGSCPVPILYRDTSILGLWFFAALDAVRSVFAGLDIEPWPIAGRAAIILAALDHRETSIGPYRELAIAVPCRRVGTRPSFARFALDMRAQEEQGTWAARLGVTSEAASAAGAELWGFPRYVTEIDARFDAAATTIETSELYVRADAPRGPSIGCLPVITYSARKGRLLRTIIELDGRARLDSGRRTTLAVRGRGPAADLLRELGLEASKPAAVLRADHVRARVPFGADLGPVGEAR